MPYDFTIELLNGRLMVNGIELEDYLDHESRRYVLMTPAEITQEILRIARMSFSAGQDAQASLPRLIPLISERLD